MYLKSIGLHIKELNMGGDRETVAPQTKQTDSGNIEECGKVRYHEKDGEVHFHDDTNGLKVAIPSGVWFQQYQTLMQEVPSSFSYADTKNRAVLNIKVQLDKPKKKKKKEKKARAPRIEMEMYLESVDVSDELAALQKFTEG
jgi:hypothetical protein